MNTVYSTILITLLNFVAGQILPPRSDLSQAILMAEDCSQYTFVTPDSTFVLSEVCASQNESDFYYEISYEHLFEDLCECDDDLIFLMGKDGAEPDIADSDFTRNVVEDGGDGSFDVNVGPGVNADLNIFFLHLGEEPSSAGGCVFPSDCSDTIPHDIVNAKTALLFAPINVEASDNAFDDQIEISWEKGTDVPEEMTGYRLYREGILIAELSGTTYSYIDSGLQPGDEYNYGVTTITIEGALFYTTPPPGTNFSLGAVKVMPFHESNAAEDQGSALSIGLEASDGTKYGVSLLEWNDLSKAADDVRIERSIPGEIERLELDILNKNATTFADETGIPGFEYTYYVTPIKEGIDFETGTDNGYSRPNGTIKGHVRSNLGAGVSGVEIHVNLLSPIPAGGAETPLTCDSTYCATTDAEGYYEIKNIYYHEEATFSIRPEKSGLIMHEFSPEASTRSLDVNSKSASGVDFTDLTVFTVGGRITYPPDQNSAACGVDSVSIFLNNNDFGILTDAEGYWDFAIQDEGEFTFTPRFLHHAFENTFGDSSITLQILGDNTDINFEDVENDSLTLVVQAGCNASLGNGVEILLTAPQGCFNQTYTIDETGVITIQDLPARDYEVQVVDIISTSSNVTNILDQIGNMPIKIDLTLRDTSVVSTIAEDTIYIPEILETLSNDSIIIVQVADTIFAGDTITTVMDVEPKVSFIYRSPLEISLDFEEAGAIKTSCPNSEGDNIVIMEQGMTYPLIFNVKEMLGEDCYIDTGFLKIYDFISDRGNEPVEVPIKGGVAIYTVNAGDPEIASNPDFHDHEKLLYVVPYVDLLEPEPLEYWVIVTGAKGKTPTFITRTPEIPWLILHDPPGDNSYAYVEKGTTYSSFTMNESFYGGSAGAFANILVGAKIKTPFSGHGFGTIINFEIEAGRDNFNREGLRTTMTFNETFSTSSLPNLTGDAGDVYIGTAYNQEFSLAESLAYDPDNCTATVDIIPALAATDFATTFVYTEHHVKNTLIPTIGFLIQEILNDREFNQLSLEDQIEVQNLISDTVTWNQILRQNELARDENASFQENISFSAGAPIARDYESEVSASTSYEYNIFVNTDFALGAKIDNEGGAWFDSELGVMGKFRWSTTTEEGADFGSSRTVGYVLDDDDIGDFFSVDILEDEDYDVPAFRLKLGTTSCPQEEGTQARDTASIFITPPEISNVPANEPANITAILTNRSESLETREYEVRVVSTTNPDGAKIYLGGQLINQKPASFFLDYNDPKTLSLSVEKGPLASNYENIGIMIYPPCEYELWQDNGNLKNVDTAYIQLLNFQTECSNVTLRNPDDGWLINQNTGNLLQTTFSGYDINNEKLESITLQIKSEGQGYFDYMTIEKSDLIGPNYDLFADLNGIDFPQW